MGRPVRSSDGSGNLYQQLKCIRLKQTNQPEGEHNDNGEHGRVFRDALSLFP